jgi:hypothetical protein
VKKRGWIPLVVTIAVVSLGWWIHGKVTLDLPTYAPTANAVWLNQNWTPEERDWFHHADQGTLTFGIPYEWLVALEQPQFTFSKSKLLSDPEYLDRFGFIPSNNNESQLPIGFAHGGPILDFHGEPWRNPRTGGDVTGVGLTCAACHTGRFTYKNTTVLIDGGPALLSLDKFQQGVGIALLKTRYLPWRFNRFAGRVLGARASLREKFDLWRQMEPVASQVRHFMWLTLTHKNVEEGYARLDALNRIGNAVFSIDLQNSSNFAGLSAPVHYPRIWNASWFEWVQYNGSIQSPMTRNAGEALGVFAQLNLNGAEEDRFSSSVQIKTLARIEQLLSGTHSPDAASGFGGLASPKWPANILPPINTDLASKGAVLYKSLCQGCHMAPVTDGEFWTSSRWLPANSAGERYINLEQIDTSHIGTDPAQAEDMKNRRVATPASLGITSSEFGTALRQVVHKTVDRWYDVQQPSIPEAVREQMNGNRPDGVQALLSYKVRPLNGIWATPPYLHNGSVPSLYALLSPVPERPKNFWLGNREYDPVNVGYVVDKLPGGFEFDTSVRGNSNSGHEFADRRGKPGVIGRQLTPDERRALIEYLKTL